MQMNILYFIVTLLKFAGEIVIPTIQFIQSAIVIVLVQFKS